MAAKRGMDFKLYRNTNTNTAGTPSWSVMNNVRDLTRNLEKSLADASTRGSTFRQQVATLKDLSIDFQMVYDEADTGFAAIEAAFFADTDIDLLLLDGPIATVNSVGIRFLAQVSKFSGNEALEDVGLNDVTVVPSYTTTGSPRRVSVVNTNTVTDL